MGLVGGSVGVFWAGAAVFCTLLLAPWIIEFRRDRWRLDVFQPILFSTVFFGMAAIALAERVATDSGWIWEVEDVVTLSFIDGMTLVVWLHAALFGFILVGYYGVGSWSPTSLGAVFPSADETRARLVRRFAILYIAVGLVFYVLLLFIALDGDPLRVFSAGSRSELFAGLHILTLGASLIYIGYFLWLAASLSEGDVPSVVECAAFVPVLGIFVTLGSRGLLMRLVLVFAVVCYYAAIRNWVGLSHPVLRRVRSISPVVGAIALPVAAGVIAAIVVVTGALRSGRSVAESVDPVALLTAGIPSNQFDFFVALTTFVPEDTPFFYGTYYLRTFTTYIPSALWPDKPVSTSGSIIRREILPDQAGGRPPGQIGDYYINFGYPGIPAMGLLYGVLMRVTYNTLLDNRTSPMAIVVYAFVLTRLFKSGLTNNGLIDTFALVAPFLPVLGVHWWLDRDSPRS